MTKQERELAAGNALIDTGASMTTLEESALQSLGLQPMNQVTVMTPSGQATQLAYPAELIFSGSQLPKQVFAAAIGSPHLAAQGIIALVGRDVLCRAILVYNGLAGMFTLAF